MASKDSGPLKFVQKECDVLQKKFEGLKVEYEDFVVDPGEESTCDSLLFRCDDLKKSLLSISEKAKKLTKEGEPVKVYNFEYKKEDEIRRIIMLLTRIDNMKKILNGGRANTSSKLSPSRKSETSKINEDAKEIDQSFSDDEAESGKPKEEEEDAEEESDDDDDEAKVREIDESDEEEEEDNLEEAEEDLEESSSLRQFEVMCDFPAEQPGDLSIHTGDILNILKIRDDGWWEAENEDGERGMVPSTYLKVYDRPYSLTGGGDGSDINQSRKKSPWKTIRKSLWNTSATDILTALGTLPSGFRESTLKKILTEDDRYTTSSFLVPKLSPSCLGFKDLSWDLTLDKIQPKTVRIQRVINIISCRQIPLPGTGIEVQSRHVRLCIFDGRKVLSNIHTTQANWNDKSPKTWTFLFRVAPGISTIEDSECFIRYNDVIPNVGILLELCVSYIRNRTGEKGELSCGWVHIPLLDESGNILTPRTYDLLIHGGTPYERGVEVDSSIRQRATSKKFKGIIPHNKQPHLIIKISQPTSLQRNYLEILPESLIGCMRYVMFIAYYRVILADTLVHDRVSMESADLIHSPLLKTFPAVIDQPDILDVLRVLWLEKMKRVKDSSKNDIQQMKKVFTQVFMESAYILHHLVSLPTYDIGDKAKKQIRKEEIEKVYEKIKKESILAVLLSSDVEMEPFEISEVSFTPFNPHCFPVT